MSVGYGWVLAVFIIALQSEVINTHQVSKSPRWIQDPINLPTS